MARGKKGLAGWVDGAKVVKVKVREPRVNVISGVVYSQYIVDGKEARQLMMTVLAPSTHERKPAVLFFPGGGWLQAARDRFIENRLAIAKAGFVVASAEYRTIPAAFPSQVEDGLAAVRFLRAKAGDFGIDPERIGVMGNSAGGWLAAMVALAGPGREWRTSEWKGFSDKVSACCCLHPVTDPSTIAEGLGEEYQAAHRTLTSPEALLLNGVSFGKPAPSEDLAKRLRAIGPIALLKGRKAKEAIPPFLIMHGSGDTVVSPAQGAALYTALKEKGAKASYTVLEGVDHSSNPAWYQGKVCGAIVDFFKDALG